MSLWKANPLQSKTDVLPRGLFRFVWCAVGLLFAVGVYKARGRPFEHSGVILALVVVITLIGMVLDRARLKPK